MRFDPDRAFNYAITVSTADAILSALPVGRAASPWLKGKGGDIIRKNFLELLKKTSTEGTISAIQGGVQDAAATHYKIDDRNPFDLQNRTFDFVVGGGTAAPFALTPQHPPTLRLDAENPPPRPPNDPSPSKPTNPAPTHPEEASIGNVNRSKPEASIHNYKAKASGISKPQDWSKAFEGEATIIRKGRPLEEIFSRDLSDAELTHLAGAPSHAIVTVDGGYGPYPEVDIRVYCGEVTEQWRKLAMSETGRLKIYNMSFKKSDGTLSGYGAHSLASQVKAAIALEADYIETYAFGNFEMKDDFNGYITWPLLGFDAKLSTDEISELPDHLTGSTTLLNLLAKEGGREWYTRNGGPKEASFSLKPGSRSLAILENYLKLRNYNINVHE